MAEIIVARGQPYELQPESYWHLVDATTGPMLLLNNAFLAEGIIATISEFRRLPGLENATGAYALRAGMDPKELVWEETRKRVDPSLPSRNGALYEFDNREIAEAVGAKWFGAERLRHLVEARVVNGSRVFKADTRWLDCEQADWQQNSARYWAGDMTASPVPEILVDGRVYFPGWQNPPFGRFRPQN